MRLVLELLGISSSVLFVASSACSDGDTCVVTCSDWGDTFALTIPCGESVPTTLAVVGPCTLGLSAGVTSVSFTDVGTCHVTATFADGTVLAAEVSRQDEAPTPGKCCSGGEQYAGISVYRTMQLGDAPCDTGGGFVYGEDAGADASD
jgi:hypothetical protein